MTETLKPGTPLPWQYRDDYTSEGFVTIIGNVDGEYVEGRATYTYDVICRCEDEFGERLPYVAKNVRYIVEACNAYPALIAKAAMAEALASEMGLDDIATQIADQCHGNRKPGQARERYAIIWQAARMGAVRAIARYRGEAK